MKRTTLLTLTTTVVTALSVSMAYAQETVPAQPSTTPPATEVSTPSAIGAAENQETEPEKKPARRKFHLIIGPEYNAFRPMSAKAANRFGQRWGGVGISFDKIVPAKNGLTFDTDANFLIGQSGKNRVYLMPLQLGGRQSWQIRKNSYYLGLLGGYCGVNLRADPEGVKAGWRFAPAFSTVAGLTLNNRAHLEYRYYRTNPVRGFNMSGTNLSLGMRF